MPTGVAFPMVTGQATMQPQPTGAKLERSFRNKSCSARDARVNLCEINSIAFSANGQQLLTASADKSVRLWGLNHRRTKSKRLMQSKGVAFSATFTASDKRVLVTSTDRQAFVYDIAADQVIRTLDGKTTWIQSADISADMSLAVTASDANASVWNVETGQPISAFARGGVGVGRVALSPDSKYYAFASDQDKEAYIIEASSGRKVLTLGPHDGQVSNISYSPDGRSVLTASHKGKVRLWDAVTGALKHALDADFAIVSSADMSPNGRWVIAGGTLQTVFVWDAMTGERLLEVEAGDLVSAVAFAPNGQSFAVGLVSGHIKIWSLQTN